MEETHSTLWRQVAATTLDRGDVVLVMLLIIFSPDTEWVVLHLPDSARRRVETMQEEWATQAHQYCRQGGVGYRTRLGEIIMTLARLRELVEIEELRVEVN